VKQLKPRTADGDSFQAARRLFDTEAQVLYALGSHDQIPRLFAHFEENHDFFLVQEFIDGEVFCQELKGRKVFSESEVLYLLQDVLTVLEFVHQQQVIHRDIKPSNLIRRKGDRHLVLIDFGAVKQIGMQGDQTEDQATLTVAVGSSSYMPNEQLAGMPRFASDLYSLGVLAIQCLTGMYARKLPEDPRTSEICWRDRVQVSVALGDFLDRMVRYDFRQRYLTAKEALADLHTLTGTEPVSTLLAGARPVTDGGYLAWLERGDELFQLQRYREAITAYKKVIQADPDNYLAWFKRGMALENLQFYEEAVESYDRVLQLQPDDYLAWYKQGSACMQLQRFPAALQAYDRVVQLQPDSYWAWHDRGKTLESMQRYEEAVASYDRAVQLKPDFQLAVENRKRLLSQLKQVDTLYHLQHYDEAVASCDRALQQDPNDALAWFMRGMALENLNRSGDAIAAYQKVVEIQPDDHLAWFKQAALLEKINAYEEALTAYHRVVQLQPHNYWAWNDRGKLLETLGQFEAAIVCYDRVVQLKPDFQTAIEGRTRILKQLHQAVLAPQPEEEDDETLFSDRRVKPVNGQSDASIPSVLQSDPGRNAPDPLPSSLGDPGPYLPEEETMVGILVEEQTSVHMPESLGEETVITQLRDESQPTDPLSPPPDASCQGGETCQEWFRQGQRLEKSQKYTEALIAFDRALEICPTHAELWGRRGSVLGMLGRHSEAETAYRQAIALHPGRADLWGNLGGCLLRLEQFEAAVTAFNQTIKLKANRHLPWYWRGRALMELHRYGEAIRSFERSIALKPDFQPAIADHKRLHARLVALGTHN
jgi:tetratricopeptide (TPR) repeat protein/tRNA A-37 threonylcarbamoyl transferase component Bud32